MVFLRPLHLIHYSVWEGKKLNKPKSQNKINTIRSTFTLKKKKKVIARIIKDKIIKGIWTLLVTEEQKKKERN